MIVVTSNFDVRDCDSLYELTVLYLKKEIDAVFIHAPIPYVHNLFMMCHPTEAFLDFGGYLHSDTERLRFCIGNADDVDTPPEYREIMGAMFRSFPNTINVNNIADMVYIESIPDQVQAVFNFMKFDLKLDSFNPVTISPDGIPVKTGMRRVPMEVGTFYPIGDSHVFVPVGVDGLGYIIPKKFYYWCSNRIRDFYTLDLEKYDEATPTSPIEIPEVARVSETVGVKGYHTQRSLFADAYLMSMASIFSNTFCKTGKYVWGLDIRDRGYYSLYGSELLSTKDKTLYNMNALADNPTTDEEKMSPGSTEAFFKGHDIMFKLYEYWRCCAYGE